MCFIELKLTSKQIETSFLDSSEKEKALESIINCHGGGPGSISCSLLGITIYHFLIISNFIMSLKEP